MAKNISNNFCVFIILLLLNLNNCQNEIPTQTVEEKDQIKNTKKTEEEKKQDEVFSLMKDFNDEWENKMINYNSDYD